MNSEESQPPQEKKELDPNWVDAVNVGLASSIESYDLIYGISPEDGYTPINLSPITLTEGLDESIFSELPNEKKEHLKKQLFSQLEVGESPEVVATYETPGVQPDDPLITVRIFKTGGARKDELFIHEVQRDGVITDYFVASESYRLT